MLAKVGGPGQPAARYARAMKLPHDDVEALMREAAARFVMPRFGALVAGESREKNPNDFVTVADLEAERFLAPALVALLPGSVALGEEAAAADARALDELQREAPVWLIDPVDGTRNFINRSRDFGVMVALVQAGAVRGGWILLPVEDAFLAAEAGAGLRLANAPPRRDGDEPRGLAVGRLADGRRAGDVARAAGFSISPHPGSAAVAYLRLAAGVSDFVVFSRTWPWDHAAGALAALEAGGAAIHLSDGAPYDARRRDSPLVAARSAALADRVRGVLTG